MPIKHKIQTDGNGKIKEVFITPMKAIRHYCKECCGFNARAVKECTSTYCPLYPYRFGKQPGRAGIGVKKTSL